MEIIIQKQQSVTISELKIDAVRDLFLEKKIIARVKGLDRGIVLWDGAEEYVAAGDWTNETALARVEELLQSENIPWAF